MKKLLLLLCIVFAKPAVGQTPGVLWLKGMGGNKSDRVGNKVSKTTDGGFIINIGTASTHGTGNLDSLCSLIGGNQNLFVKYNSDATVREWTKYYQWNGDTTLPYIFPQNGGTFILGGGYNYPWGMYICKQDASGNIIWSHGYSYGNGLQLTDMVATKDGGYLMLGASFYTDTNVLIHYGSTFDADIFVMKVDSNGNKIWGKVIGGTAEDDAYSLVMGLDNGCYVIGKTLSNDYDCTGNHGAIDVYVTRLDNDGNIIWHRDLGGINGDGASCAVANGNKGILVAAATLSTDGDIKHSKGAGDNIWVINIDSDGNTLWDNCYGGEGNCYPNGLCKAANGDVWIAGVSQTQYGEIDTTYGADDAWFVHTDSNGKFLNAKVLGSHKEDRGTMTYPLSDGNILAGGFYDTSDGAFRNAVYYGADDVFLAEFSPTSLSIENTLTIGNELRIYPNPAREQITIEKVKLDNCELEITDLLGRLVYKSNLSDKAEVITETWTRGIYYVHIISENGYRNVQKIVVQ